MTKKEEPFIATTHADAFKVARQFLSPVYVAEQPTIKSGVAVVAPHLYIVAGNSSDGFVVGISAVSWDCAIEAARQDHADKRARADERLRRERDEREAREKEEKREKEERERGEFVVATLPSGEGGFVTDVILRKRPRPFHDRYPPFMPPTWFDRWR